MSLRHHIAILFDPCTEEAQKQEIQLKKSSYQLQFNRSYLSLILECISEYMRIIFDLHPSFITFDIISCGNKIHSQTSITKQDYVKTLERFAFINGVKNANQTKFVEAMEQFLLELPSDFYNSHKYSSPFGSNQIPPITHILFIARNQKNVGNYQYLIDEETNTKISFTNICKSAKKRNHSIQKVYTLKYGKSDQDNKPWTKATHFAYRKKEEYNNDNENDNGDIDMNKNQKNDDDDDDDGDNDLDEEKNIEMDDNKSEMIEFYECIININKLHDTLLDLMCNIQFGSRIRRINIVNVPFKDPLTQIKTSLSIPMVCCIDNINHKHLYNIMYFTNYDIEYNKQYDDILSLQWSKVPDSDKFDWSDWITQNMILITPSKLDDTSRLLMKFINKKKIATLRANYKPHAVNNYFIKSKFDNKLRITHAVKLIGMQLYLITIINTKNIEGYNTTYNDLRTNNEHYLNKNKKFPFNQYCLQSYLLPNAIKKDINSHCFKHWIENKKISKAFVDILPPFFKHDNKLNIMEMNETKVDATIDNSSGVLNENINNFGRYKQFVSSSHLTMISSQLEPNATIQIGKELTAKTISDKCHNGNIKTSTNQKNNISLFDLLNNTK